MEGIVSSLLVEVLSLRKALNWLKDYKEYNVDIEIDTTSVVDVFRFYEDDWFLIIGFSFQKDLIELYHGF